MFFFFKQKTAYEIKECDWSSDVCSSDLVGYKEASHFLRNIGFKNLAILDRHILNLMLEEGLIEERPKPLGGKKYLGIEKRFLKLAKGLKMPAAELDLFMWFMKTGKVLK